MYQQMPPPQMLQAQQSNPALPFSKLSISDAIGLVTLRLGRVEQFIIDLESGEHQHLRHPGIGGAGGRGEGGWPAGRGGAGSQRRHHGAHPVGHLGGPISA